MRLCISPSNRRLLAQLLFWHLATSSLSAQPLETNRLADVLQPYVEQHEIAGAVTVVANRDGILDTTTLGEGDLATHAPMRSDTLFWIASQSKPIAATALMMLVDEGKVNVDDPVEKYLPAFRGQMRIAQRGTEYALLIRPVHPPTLRDLLTHSSGLPYSSALEVPTLDTLPLRAAVGSYAMTPLNFEPGSQYHYANAGLNTVGRIVEVVSGMPYEEFLRTRIFEPLRMKDTTFWPDAAQLKRLATAYGRVPEDERLHEVPIGVLHYPLDDRQTRYPIPAAGLFSTAADCTRFCRMILRGGELDGRRYLSEEAVRAMTSRQTPPAWPVSYGFGWSVDGARCGHSGAFASDMGMDRDAGLIFIYLVQRAGFKTEAERGKEAFWQAAYVRFPSPQATSSTR